PEEDLEALGMGILMMDLGMLQLPAELHAKEGPLSFDEWSWIKRHPALGIELLEGLEGVPELAREVIFGHHERLDGSGYPQGLRAAEIGRALRVVAIADTFATLTCGSELREPLTTYEALRHMQSELAPGLDPALVSRFVSLLGREDGASTS
ncbi:MAG: HD-GYP domain-containing protein, partial [Planctomycetota bacterium]